MMMRETAHRRAGGRVMTRTLCSWCQTLRCDREPGAVEELRYQEAGWACPVMPADTYRPVLASTSAVGPTAAIIPHVALSRAASLLRLEHAVGPVKINNWAPEKRKRFRCVPAG